MKCKKLIYILILVMVVAIVSATTDVYNTENKFNNGSYTNMTYNATTGALQLGKREIGAMFSESYRNKSLTDAWHFDNSTWNAINASEATATSGVDCNKTSDNQINDSCYFHGVSDYISTGRNMINANSGTISAWIKTKEDNTFEYIAHDTGGYFTFYRDQNEKMTFSIYDGGGKKAIDTTVMSNNIWYHFVGTWNSTDIRLARNGKIVATTSAGVISNTNGIVNFGKGGVNYMNGALDEIILWNKSLTSHQIRQLYQAQAGKYLNGNYTSLINDTGATNQTIRNITYYSKNLNLTLFYGNASDLSDAVSVSITNTNTTTFFNYTSRYYQVSTTATTDDYNITPVLFNFTVEYGEVAAAPPASGGVTLNATNIGSIYPNDATIPKIQFNRTTSSSTTSSNTFAPQYIFAHTNETMPVLGAGQWTNITFAQEETYVKEGISHTHSDGTNYTFTIMEDGVYNIDYDLDMEDTSPGASDINVAGRLIFQNGTEVKGSVFETDIVRQGAEAELTHNFLADCNAGDVFVFQFIASDADVQISTHGTYGDHPESATILMNKIANT